jgi:hypothetical protein
LSSSLLSYVCIVRRPGGASHFLLDPTQKSLPVGNSSGRSLNLPRPEEVVLSQPIFEYRRVDASEVEADFQIPVLQVHEAWRRPHQSRLDTRTGQEDRARRAVVRAGRAISPHTAAEGRHGYPVSQPSGSQVVQERLEGAGELEE